MPQTVADIMDTDTPTVYPEDTVESVLRTLFGGLVFLEPLSHFEERLRKATAALARDLMTEDPVTIEASASVHEAARTIARTKHNRLPVVEHGRLSGVVTRVDVLDALTRA